MGGKSGLLTNKVPWKTQVNQGGRKLMDSATENNRLAGFTAKQVRVKTCGKSARLCVAIRTGGKPYLEQDKAVRPVVCSDLNVRVCCIEKWLPHCS